MEPEALVSYVLVNWRTEEYLPEALESIRRQRHSAREVILVDNGSENFDAASVARFQPLTLITNQSNTGFTAANNQAIREARGDFIVLLNCDAWIEPDFTARALAVFQKNPRIGIVVPKLLAADGSGRIDSAGHLMYRDRTTAHRGRGERDQGQYDRAGFVFGGTAAAVVYRREMLEQIETASGPFDESFFAYYEDVDIDWRSALAGWLAYYEPRCIGHHVGHGSGGRASLRVQMLAEKNRYLMLLKNDSLPSQLSSLGPLKLYESWHLLRTLLKPWLWPSLLLLLANLPRAVHYRLTAQRSVAPAQVAAGFARRGHQPPPAACPPDPPFAVEPGRDCIEEPTGDEVQFPLVSVVVVNFNNLHLTKACMESLLAQSYERLEVILVDNGSSADEAELLAMHFPDIRTLRLERNSGFSGGVNWGASLASGEYIALVNNDCVLDTDCIRHLIYCARRMHADAVSGRLLNVKRSADILPALHALEFEKDSSAETIWQISAEIEEALSEADLNHGVSLYGYIVRDAYGEDGGCFYPSGGLCLLRHSALSGLLPELFPQHYFAYHEDVELGLALRIRGKKIVKEPKAAAAHLEGSTAQRMKRTRLRFYQERNRLLNIIGFYPAWLLWRMLPLLLLLNCLALLTALFSAPQGFVGMLAAHLWIICCPGELLRWRRRCRRDQRVAEEQWLGELSGQVRGQGGALNAISLAWCRMMGIPCRELRKHITGVE